MPEKPTRKLSRSTRGLKRYYAERDIRQQIETRHVQWSNIPRSDQAVAYADAGVEGGAEGGCWVMENVNFDDEYARFRHQIYDSNVDDEFLISKGRYIELWTPVLKSLNGRWRRHAAASTFDCFVCAHLAGCRRARSVRAIFLDSAACSPSACHPPQGRRRRRTACRPVPRKRRRSRRCAQRHRRT